MGRYGLHHLFCAQLGQQQTISPSQPTHLPSFLHQFRLRTPTPSHPALNTPTRRLRRRLPARTCTCTYPGQSLGSNELLNAYCTTSYCVVLSALPSLDDTSTSVRPCICVSRDHCNCSPSALAHVRPPTRMTTRPRSLRTPQWAADTSVGVRNMPRGSQFS